MIRILGYLIITLSLIVGYVVYMKKASESRQVYTTALTEGYRHHVELVLLDETLVFELFSVHQYQDVQMLFGNCRKIESNNRQYIFHLDKQYIVQRQHIKYTKLSVYPI